MCQVKLLYCTQPQWLRLKAWPCSGLTRHTCKIPYKRNLAKRSGVRKMPICSAFDILGLDFRLDPGPSGCPYETCEPKLMNKSPRARWAAVSLIPPLSHKYKVSCTHQQGAGASGQSRANKSCPGQLGSQQGDCIPSLDKALQGLGGYQMYSLSVRKLVFYLTSTTMAIKKVTSGAENTHMVFLCSAVCLLHQAQIQQCLSCLCFPQDASWWKQTTWGLASIRWELWVVRGISGV